MLDVGAHEKRPLKNLRILGRKHALLQCFYKNYYITVEKSRKSIYNIQSKLYHIGGIKMATRDKNIWILMVFLLSGLVIGGLLGEIASKVDWLWWLSYGESFGISSPIELDLSVIKITFGLMFKINIASIVGMGLAIFIYRKV